MRPSDRSPKCRNQNPSNSSPKVRTKRRRVRKTLLSRSWSKLLTVAKSLIMALHTRTTPKPHFRSTTTTNPETASLNSSSSKEVSRSSIDHRTTIDNHITRISLRTSSSSTTLKRSRSTQPNTSHLTRSTLLPSSSNTMR